MTDDLPDCLCGHSLTDHLREQGHACKRPACGCQLYRLPNTSQQDLWNEEPS